MTTAALRDYMEEMELKIRYMKNDIEFKKNQISSKNTAKRRNDSSNDIQKSQLKSLCTSTFHKPVVSVTMATESGGVAKNFSGNNVHGNTKLINMSKRAASKWNISRNAQPILSGPNQSFPSVLHATNFPQAVAPPDGNPMRLQHHGLKQTHRIVCLPSSSRTVIPPLPAASMRSEQRTSMQFSNPTASVPISTISQESYNYAFSNKRRVLLPSKNLSAPPVSCISVNSKLTIETMSPPNPRDISSRLIEQQIVRSDLIFPSHPHLQTTKGINHSAQINNRYKLVKNSVSKLSNASISGIDSCANSVTPVLSCGKPVTPAQVLAPISSSAFSGKLKSAACNLNQGKSPKLNVQTAAKVVTKYKLKRLSPTSASKTPPSLLFDNSAPNKRYLKTAKRMGNTHMSSSRHKLDRRPVSSSTPKDSMKSKLQQSQSHTGKHVIVNQMKQQPQRQKHFQRNARSVLKLDKRFKQLEHEKKQFTWADTKTNKLFQQSSSVSKFKWRKSPSEPCTSMKSPTGLLKANCSRFKWSRSNLQTQHGDWQQLRQKLKLLLNRKQRNLRRTFLRKVNSSGANNNRYSSVLARRDKSNLVIINGIMYRSSNRKLLRAREAPEMSISYPSAKKKILSQKMKLISVRGSHFHIDRTGKKLSRTGIPNQSREKDIPSDNIRTKMDMLCRSLDENARLAASRAVNRSIAIATAKQKRKKVTADKRTQHCIFFGRFGRCHRGNKCPFIHDQDKVAVCTRFLRGKCDVAACPFSHKASIHKMPVCLFYLRGSCSRENCPYLHVKVHPNAPVCKDFRSGFCALGEKCKNIHSYVCPSFAMTGVCPRGNLCTMLHRIRKKETTPSPSKTRAGSTTQQSPTKKSSLSASSSLPVPEVHCTAQQNERKLRPEEQVCRIHAPTVPCFTPHPSLMTTIEYDVPVEKIPENQYDKKSLTKESLSTMASSATTVAPVFARHKGAEPSFISLLSNSSEIRDAGVKQGNHGSAYKITPAFITTDMGHISRETDLSAEPFDLLQNCPVHLLKSDGQHIDLRAKSQPFLSENCSDIPGVTADKETLLTRSAVEEVQKCNTLKEGNVLISDDFKAQCQTKGIRTVPFSETTSRRHLSNKELEHGPIYTNHCHSQKNAHADNNMENIEAFESSCVRTDEEKFEILHTASSERVRVDQQPKNACIQSTVMSESEATQPGLREPEHEISERNPDCVFLNNPQTLTTLAKGKVKPECCPSNSTESQSQGMCLATGDLTLPSSYVSHTHSSRAFQTADYIRFGGSTEETSTDSPQTSVPENIFKDEVESTPKIIPLFISHQSLFQGFTSS